MESVEAGKASFPITTSPASVIPHQRGKEQAEAAGAWTIGAVEMSPTRMGIHFQFAGEDAMRVPGLEDALVRDMRMALRERMDYVVFNGDDGATPNAGDIAWTVRYPGADRAARITQANKVKWPETIEEFAALIDGLHAEDLGRSCAWSRPSVQRGCGDPVQSQTPAGTNPSRRFCDRTV